MGIPQPSGHDAVGEVATPDSGLMGPPESAQESWRYQRFRDGWGQPTRYFTPTKLIGGVTIHFGNKITKESGLRFECVA